MIISKDISVAIQGEFKADITPKIVASVHQYLPDAEVILSVCEGDDISNIKADKIIFNKDVGAFPYSSLSDSKTNNINRQIFSTFNVLNAASRPYVLKIRTDFYLTGNGFLKYFDACPKSDPSFQIFEHKIINCSHFARNPRKKAGRFFFPFHPSDMVLFGLTTDLKNLFDIPLMPENEIFYWKDEEGISRNRYVPEQYLFINCLLKNGKTIEYDHYCSSESFSLSLTEQTERLFASNFIFLGYNRFNLKPPEKFYDPIINDYNSVLIYTDGLNLYQKYVDPDFIVTENDNMECVDCGLFLKILSNIFYFCSFFLDKKIRKAMKKKIRYFFVMKEWEARL